MSEKITNKILINRGIPYDGAVDNGAYAQYDTDLIIPLPFFFSRKYSGDEYDTNQPNRPYFPLCAIHKQKLEFTFVRGIISLHYGRTGNSGSELLVRLQTSDV